MDTVNERDDSSDLTFDPHLEMRQKLDEEINELTERLRLLRSKRNTIIPIAALPSEVLQHILLLSNDSTFASNTIKAAIIFSSISQQWRNIALDTPSLWSFIEHHNSDIIELAITRSKTQPLHLNLCFEESCLGGYHTLVQLFKNIGKVKKLEITGYADLFSDIDTSEIKMWGTSAPLLEQLHLEQFPLIDPCLYASYPALISLHLDNCTFDWDACAGLFPNLLDLSIIYPSCRIQIRTFIDTFLIPIASRIEKLALSWVFDDPSPTPPPAKRIYLENLKEFRPRDDKESLLTLFQHISLPHNVSAHLVLYPYDETQLPKFQEFIACRGLDTLAWPVKSLFIMYRGFMKFIEDWGSRPEHPNANYFFSSDDSLGGVTFASESSDAYIDTLFRHQIFPLTPIVSIIFQDCPSDAVFDYLRTLDSIEFITFHSGSLFSCGSWMEDQIGLLSTEGLEWWRDKEEDKEDSEKEKHPFDVDVDIGCIAGQRIIGFRALKEVRIYCWKDGKVYDPFHHDDVYQFFRWLEVRKRLEMPVSRVLIEGMGVTPGLAKLFERDRHKVDGIFVEEAIF